MNAEDQKTRDAVLRVVEDAEVIRPALPDGVILTRGDEIRMEPIRWLWDGWLARGKMHLLAGAPGQGKTTIALGFAAAVTCGGAWPDGTRVKPGNVVIYSGEDDPADTLGPRLKAAGADLRRISFVSGVSTGGRARAFDLAEDLPKLKTAIAQVDGGVDLLIVDPIVTAVTGDSHKNTETRRGLQPLADLAASCDCALLGITHFTKGGQGIDPAARVIGSVAFTALARVVMVAAKTQGEDGTPVRVLARAKSNISADDGGFQYAMDFIDVADGVQAMRIGWGKAVPGTARELLSDPDEDTNDTSELIGLLNGELAGGGWYPAKGVDKSLQEAGFSKKQIWVARRRLGVIARKGGFKTGWYWRLPGGSDPQLPTQDSPEDFQDSHKKEREPWESSTSGRGLLSAQKQGEATGTMP